MPAAQPETGEEAHPDPAAAAALFFASREMGTPLVLFLSRSLFLFPSPLRAPIWMVGCYFLVVSSHPFLGFAICFDLAAAH